MTAQPTARAPDRRQLHLRILGSPFTISCPDQAVCDVLGRWWSSFAATPDPDAQVLRLPPATDPEQLAAAISSLLAVVNAQALDSARLFATHAGVIAHGTATIAFPAASGVGKSTLTAACLREGAGYVSDEALCLDWATGAVTAYPRPIGLLPWSRRALSVSPTWTPAEAETYVSAEDLGSAPVDPPPPLRHIVLLTGRGRGRPRLEPVSRQDAAAALLTRSFNHWRNPARSFAMVHDVVATASTWQLRSGAPGPTAALLLERLGASRAT